MKALLALFVSLVVLSVVAKSEAAQAHPMTSKILSGFARGLYGDEMGKEMMLNGRFPCLGCTLGTFAIHFTRRLRCSRGLLVQSRLPRSLGPNLSSLSLWILSLPTLPFCDLHVPPLTLFFPSSLLYCVQLLASLREWRMFTLIPSIGLLARSATCFLRFVSELSVPCCRFSLLSQHAPAQIPPTFGEISQDFASLCPCSSFSLTLCAVTDCVLNVAASSSVLLLYVCRELNRGVRI